MGHFVTSHKSHPSHLSHSSHSSHNDLPGRCPAAPALEAPCAPLNSSSDGGCAPSLITIQLSKINHPVGFGAGRRLGSPKRRRPHAPSCLKARVLMGVVSLLPQLFSDDGKKLPSACPIQTIFCRPRQNGQNLCPVPKAGSRPLQSHRTGLQRHRCGSIPRPCSHRRT